MGNYKFDVGFFSKYNSLKKTLLKKSPPALNQKHSIFPSTVPSDIKPAITHYSLE